MIRLVIADDDLLVTTSLKTIVEASGEIEVVGIGKNSQEAIKLYEEAQPDVVLLDIRMGESTGLEAAVTILSKDKTAKVLLLTTFSDDEYIAEALRSGIKGYLLKQDLAAIVPSIKAVNNGQSVFEGSIIERLPDLLQTKNTDNLKAFNLNEKDYSILSLVAEGLNNKEIAERLFLSEGTTRNYISHLLEKLELRDRTQLAVFYYKNIYTS
ncbi:response regulator transcription factor [Enterococcus sp. UD-01]|jgi:DNA-binding NarL/FixJ family response regulator|uniref:response regulator transcription factor n=1 Tax=Enterococcus sp. UD-01 TaxID=3373911 RepID=UPI003839867D